MYFGLHHRDNISLKIRQISIFADPFSALDIFIFNIYLCESCQTSLDTSNSSVL